MNNINKIKNLTKELLQYSYEYYVLDSPTIPDIEYDKKFDTLKKLEDEENFWLSNSPTRKVQGEVLPYLEKVHHSIPMLSADKSTDIEDVIKFKGDKMITASYKLDGSTVVLKYNDHKLYQGLSRGSGIDGEDITHTVKMIKNIPLTIPYGGYLEIRGEALIPWDYYHAMNADNSLGHPRNVASGALRQLDANEAAKRNIYFYAFTLINWKEVCDNTNYLPLKADTLNFLSSNGFDVVPHYNVPAFDTGTELKRVISFLDRESYKNPTDGWCFEYSDLVYGESLGSTSHHDRRLYALKPNIEEYTTTFRGVEYNTCRTGIVSLTALFNPVEISNTIVSRATLHNVDYFNNLELGEGDEIIVAKMNEIIPGVLGNNTRSNTYELIDICPSCGNKLIIKNTGAANVLYCDNENCPSKKLAQFTHFVSRNCANIDGLSEKTLEQFISKGYIHTFEDIYHLSDYRNELVRLDGFGKKSIDKLLESIEKSRNIKLENFIAALGIPDVGLSTAKVIANHCNNDISKFLYLIPRYDWSFLDGIGSMTACKIMDFMQERLEEMGDLILEFNFIEPEKNEVKENPFTGKSLCVTGKLNHFTRNSLNEKIVSLGAKAASSVSSKTDYLITNEASGSSKYKKAIELNIPILTEEDFLQMIGE